MTSTIMARPPAAVTADDEEPEPQHERDTSNPDEMPPLPRRAQHGVDPHAQLHSLVAHLVADGDARAMRPARRTLGQMDPVRQVARDSERNQMAWGVA